MGPLTSPCAAPQDHTADQWLTAFQETGTDIMGMPADDLAKLQIEHPVEFEKVMGVRLLPEPCNPLSKTFKP